MAPPPKIRLAGFEKSIPSGYVVGRVDPGTGDAQLIDISTLAEHLVATSIIASPGGTIGLTKIPTDRVLGNVSGADAIPTATALTQPAAGLTITGGASAFTFALANDLAALEAMSGTGLVARTASETYAQRSLVAPAAGLTISNNDGVSGNPTFALADDLAALEAMSGTGLVARTAANTYAQRTLTGPAAGISVSNGNGVAGNPTLALANDLAAVEGLAGTGLAVRTASDTWTNRTITGTANRITLTNGDGVAGNPTIDIAATYVGQATITTLGTIGTGTWQGTVIAGQYGGTGVANTGKTITLGGNLTTSGAFATTLTVTATTNSTLPAGTHTLAGLDVAQTWTAQQIWAVNDAGAYPATTARGWTITSNFLNDGGARVDMWNLDTANVLTDRFAWIYKTGASTAVQMAQWLGDATFVEFDMSDAVTPTRLVYLGKTTGGEGYTGTSGADDFTIYTGNVAALTISGTTQKITVGTWNGTKIGLAYGGTNADLSATGGANKVLMQTSAGAAITVAQLAASNLSDGTTGSGSVVLAAAPTLSGAVKGAASQTMAIGATGLTGTGAPTGTTEVFSVAANASGPFATLVANNADASGSNLLSLMSFWNTNTAGQKQMADILVVSDGATANQRGANIFLRTKANGAGGLNNVLLAASNGDIRVGTGSAIATNSTGKFLLIPGCAGTPTGTPTNAAAGAIALVYDTTNHKLYAYDQPAGAWKSVTLT